MPLLFSLCNRAGGACPLLPIVWNAHEFSFTDADGTALSCRGRGSSRRGAWAILGLRK